MSPSKPKNPYLRTQVLTAGPGELRLMLFDGAIRFAEQARSALAAKDYESAFNAFVRAQDIVMELINGLRPSLDPELYAQLSGLYTFIYQRLVSASTERDPSRIDEALQLLRYERETWALLLEKLARENKRAGTLDETPEPDAAPAAAPEANGSTSQLVGGRVSVKG
jgi:flagellar secretion chaperone FliS